MVPYRTVKLVSFSPTGATRRVLEAIARALPAERVERLDLTPPQADTAAWDLIEGELALIGAPVYAGRIPAVAERRLRRVSGRNAAAVVVAVYGNRAYEDALIELRDLAIQRGFTPVAGAAFVGEHSFSTPGAPIAAGRPDAQDERAAARFAAQVRTKLAQLESLDAAPLLDVPGDAPYKERGPGMPIIPTTRQPSCTLCGACARACPTGAIAVGDQVSTRAEHCILCYACVRECPTEARVLDNPRFWQVMARRSAEWGARKEPETYL